MKRTTLEVAIQMMNAASDDPIRHNINGVLINSEAKQVTLVATTGNILVERVLDDELPAGKWILSRSDLPAAKAMLKEYAKYMDTIACVEEQVPVPTHETTAKGKLILGDFNTRLRLDRMDTYPDYRHVIPKIEQPAHVVAFDVDLLVSLSKALRDDGRGKMIATLILPANPFSPILIETGTTKKTGVLMPFKTERAKQFEQDRKDKLEQEAKKAVS